MKFLDLFAGIGGFRRGLERSGHTCIGHVEIDKYANKSYMAMYGLEACPYGVDSGPNSCKMCSPEVREDCDGKTCNGEWYAKDIKQIRAGEIPKAEIWTFGFPCTDISISAEWQDFMEREVDFFLQLLVCSKARLPKINPDTLSLRMLNILCQAKKAQLLPPFSLNYGKQGMTQNGVLLIPKSSEFPSTGKGCTLLDILETDVPEKYFLSAEQTLRLLKDS